MRWVSCLALWWALTQVWPRQRTEITWVTFLFAIYPGFRQQYIALIYSHDWIVIALFFLSMGLMIAAIRKPKWFWPLMILSWILSAYTMFADEYYFGLELLRPVFLWLVLKEQIEDRRKRLGRVLLLWLPYIGLMSAFLVWRLFLHVSPRGQVQIFDQITNNPLLGVFNLLKTIVLDVLESGLLAWALPFNLTAVVQPGVTSIFVYLLLAAGVAALTVFFLDRLQLSESSQAEPSQAWAKQAAIIGLFSLFIAGWPFWATGWQIGLEFPWDRFNLAMNFGASLMLVGLLSLLLRRRLLTIIALGVIIGISSASAYHLANLYRQDWELMKQFFWQMSWRVPGIEPNTILLTNRPPFTYSTDNSLTAPLNWLYAPDLHGNTLPYLFYDVASHSPEMWNSIDPAKPLVQQYRMLNFDGSFGQAISIFYKPPNCVKVMDPIIDRDLPGKPLFITAGAQFSRPDLIVTDPTVPASPPAELFGQEPTHGWCYDFEKAELARQTGNWARVAEIGDQALAISPKMTEANVLEWMPYIEGYAHVGQLSKAEQLSQKVYQVHPKMRRTLCSLWGRAQNETPASPEKDRAVANQMKSLNCSAPDEN